jgi:hypothetical protein
MSLRDGANLSTRWTFYVQVGTLGHVSLANEPFLITSSRSFSQDIHKILELEPTLNQINLVYILTLLAYLPYFENIKVGLWDHHAVCVSASLPP